MMARAAQLFFYPQGVLSVNDQRGKQITELCCEWYVVIIRMMLDRGQIDNDTFVRVPGAFHGTVGQLRQAKGF